TRRSLVSHFTNSVGVPRHPPAASYSMDPLAPSAIGGTGLPDASVSSGSIPIAMAMGVGRPVFSLSRIWSPPPGPVDDSRPRSPPAMERVYLSLIMTRYDPIFKHPVMGSRVTTPAVVPR